MSHWKNLSNYNYLGSYSLEGKCQEIVVTLKKIDREKVTGPGGKVDYCAVGYFDENEVNGVEIKPMVLNKTNCKAIEKAYGTGEVEEWIGKRITVYLTSTKFQRDMVPCLRVRDKKPAPATTKPVYACEMCGAVIDEQIYRASVAKYGVALCSAGCKAEYDKKQAEAGNEENEEIIVENEENKE